MNGVCLNIVEAELIGISHTKLPFTQTLEKINLHFLVETKQINVTNYTFLVELRNVYLLN
jgi:hypothetical protein